MAVEFVGGAALGTAFGLLFDAVKETKDKALMFKTALNDLGNTLKRLETPIKDIQRLNKKLNLPPEETTDYELEMKNGRDLVLKCNNVHRLNFFKKSRYTDKLGKLDKKLKELNEILQTQTARDNKENLVLTREIHTRMMEGHDHLPPPPVSQLDILPS